MSDVWFDLTDVTLADEDEREMYFQVFYNVDILLQTQITARLYTQIYAILAISEKTRGSILINTDPLPDAPIGFSFAWISFLART